MAGLLLPHDRRVELVQEWTVLPRLGQIDEICGVSRRPWFAQEQHIPFKAGMSIYLAFI